MPLAYWLMKISTLFGGKMRLVKPAGFRNLAPQDYTQAQRANLKLVLFLVAAMLSIGPIAAGWPWKAFPYIAAAWKWFVCTIWGYC